MQTFREQIITYGKNFAAIAEFLDRKTVKDCVLYYYLTKKRQNYKALMGKKRKKPPRCYKPPVMPRLEEVALRAPQDANDVTSKFFCFFVTIEREIEYFCKRQNTAVVAPVIKITCCNDVNIPHF